MDSRRPIGPPAPDVDVPKLGVFPSSLRGRTLALCIEPAGGDGQGPAEGAHGIGHAVLAHELKRCGGIEPASRAN